MTDKELNESYLEMMMQIQPEWKKKICGTGDDIVITLDFSNVFSVVREPWLQVIRRVADETGARVVDEEGIVTIMCDNAFLIEIEAPGNFPEWQWRAWTRQHVGA